MFRQTEPINDAGAVIADKKNMAFSVRRSRQWQPPSALAGLLVNVTCRRHRAGATPGPLARGQGTTVTNGKARGVVVATGQASEIGKIWEQITAQDDQKRKTPLEEKLDEFGDLLSKVPSVTSARPPAAHPGSLTQPAVPLLARAETLRGPGHRRDLRAGLAHQHQPL